MSKYFTYILICSLLVTYVNAQNIALNYAAISEEKWLPHQSVNAIYQDKTGVIWAGTNAGLNKYNLNGVVNYNLTKIAENRLLNNAVRCINEDENGNILVGTESGLGLLNVTNGTLKVLTNNDETITEIKKGKKGIFWLLTGSGKIYKLNTTLAEKTQQKNANYLQLFFDNTLLNTSNAKIKTLVELSNNDLLVATTDGLFCINAESKKAISLNFNFKPTAIFNTNENTFWVGTASNGIFQCTINQSTLVVINNVLLNTNEKVINNYVTNIRQGSNDNIIVTTPLQVFNLQKKYNSTWLVTPLTEAQTFNESAINTVLLDNTANIWVGSKRGLYKIKKLYLNANYIPIATTDFKPENLVTDLVALNDNILWIATSLSGVYSYNVSNGEQQKIKLPFDNCRLIRKSATGNIIILNNNQLIEIAASNTNSISPSYKILAQGPDWYQAEDIVETSVGQWWACTWTGKLLFATEGIIKPTIQLNNLFANQFSNQSHLFAIIKDANNNIWVGSRGEGIVKVNMQTGVIQKYNKSSGSSDRILCIKEDSKGRIWVGTRGNGLQLYQPNTNSFKIYDEKDGLSSNTICSIEENVKGEIWVSTLNGVACMQNGEFIPFQSFNYQDGINNTEFLFQVAASLKNGMVFFGAGSALYGLSKTPQANVAVVPVVFTNIHLLNGANKNATIDTTNTNLLHQINNAQTITLQHNQNSFRVGFASLDFTTPEKTRYVYRLVGKDTGWIMVQGTNQQVQYLDVEPGNYVFEVKVANAYGEWPTQSQSFAIEIKPAFWQTKIAYLIYCILFISVFVLFIFLRKRWYKLNKQLEQEQATTKAHTRQMVFYTDLSHEIKNRLSLLLGPLEQALIGKKVNPQILNNLYEQGIRLKKLTDQIMNIRKSESGEFLLNVSEENINNIIQQIVNEAFALAVVKNIHINFIAKQENIQGWCDEEILEIVVMNLVNNAIKYCHIGGSVEVKIDTIFLGENELQSKHQKEGNYLYCTISDTGLGIAKEEIEKILEPYYRAKNTKYNKKDTPGTGIGLDLVARLIRKHHGSLDIKSELNEFTIVSFYLPIDKLNYSITELKPNIVHAPIIMNAQVQEHIHEQRLILPKATNLKNNIEPLPKKEWQILVVDDNPEIISLIANAFSLEFNIHKANNGEEALALLENQTINLIISDLDMPIMDGLTLCRHIRAKESIKNLPFIILTGRNSEEQKLVCFQNQVDDFIEKPFSLELLKWKTKTLLRSNQQKVKLKTVMVVEPVQEINESVEDKFIQDIVNLIEKNLDKNYLDVDFLAENMFTSRATFYRKMEQMVGESPSLFIRKYRLKKAALFLQSGNHSVAEAAYKTGFANPKYFTKCFQKEFGVPPKDYFEQNTK